MRYLFFLLSILYSFIFYVFYTFSLNKDIFFNDLQIKQNIVNLSIFDNIIFSDSNTLIIQSIFGNLLFEIIIFFLISIFLFYFFGKYNSLEEENEEEKYDKNTGFFGKIFTFGNFIKLIKKFSYYVGFILFYISIYLISISFDFINFSFFILILNIVIYLIFFITKFSSISKNFLRINSIIFSLFYIINYFYIIFTNNNYFNLVDFINSFLILLIFPTLLYLDKQISKKESYDYAVLINFSIYIFSVLLFYFYYYLFKQNLVFWVSFISTIFGIIWFEFLPKINFLKKEKINLRYIGIIFNYIGILFGIIFLTFEFSYIIFFILILQTLYNYFIHKKYINYISLFLSLFLLFYLFYYFIIYFNIIDFKSFNFFILGIIISFLIIIYTYILKLKNMLDYYIIHFFSYLINFISIIIFFIFNNFEILYIGVLLLLESIYFFLSYNKLNPKTKKNNYNIHL